MPASRKLRVFLSYAKEDFAAVHELFNRLKSEDWIEPWQDKSELLPGVHWTAVIKEEIDNADAVIIFLSDNSINKEGFVHREMNYMFERSLQKPPGIIYRIPIRLEECEAPEDFYDLGSRQWVDYFGEQKEEAYTKLLMSLQVCLQQRVRFEEKARARAEALAKKEAERRLKEQAEELYRKTNAAVRFEWVGDLENALKVYWEIRSIDPTFPNVGAKVSELQELIRVRDEKMLKEAQRLAEIQAAEKQAEEKRRRDAEMAAQIEAAEKARRDAQQRAKQFAEQIRTMHSTAQQYEMRGELDSALKIYNEIKSINPTFPDINRKISDLEIWILRRKEKERKEIQGNTTAPIQASTLSEQESERKSTKLIGDIILIGFAVVFLAVGSVFVFDGYAIAILQKKYGFLMAFKGFMLVPFAHLPVIMLGGLPVAGPILYHLFGYDIISGLLVFLQLDPNAYMELPSWLGGRLTLNQSLYLSGYLTVILMNLAMIGSWFTKSVSQPKPKDNQVQNL